MDFFFIFFFSLCVLLFSFCILPEWRCFRERRMLWPKRRAWWWLLGVGVETCQGQTIWSPENPALQIFRVYQLVPRSRRLQLLVTCAASYRLTKEVRDRLGMICGHTTTSVTVSRRWSKWSGDDHSSAPRRRLAGEMKFAENFLFLYISMLVPFPGTW